MLENWALHQTMGIGSYLIFLVGLTERFCDCANPVLYLDTGCLVKLYYPEPESAAVEQIVLGKAIIFTDLHELEITL